MTFMRAAKKASFLSAVLIYESLAGILRIVVLLYAAPCPSGPAFYTGLTMRLSLYFETILGPLATPSTVLTSLVWLRFTLFRSTVPKMFDVLIFSLTLGASL